MNTKLVFDYDPTLNLDLIAKILEELYPEYPNKKKSKVLRLRKNAISTVGIDIKEDYDKKQSVIQIYHKPSFGAQLFMGAFVLQTAGPFVQEVGLSLKTGLATQYHLLEESQNVKPRWTTRNRAGVGIILMFFAFIATICITETVESDINTLIFEISEDGRFSGFGTKIRGGQTYSYLGTDGVNKKIISKDSTYIYNATNDDWLLYSVDYKAPLKSVEIPESIAIWVPARSVVACEKMNESVSSHDPMSTTTLYERDIQRGYRRDFYLQESTKALENLSTLYGE